MAYGQKNYSQTQGRPNPDGNPQHQPKYRINQIGCFITAFCNLRERKGRPIDPASLNAEFIARRIYVDVDDGILDDVGYASISQFDPNIVVTGQGGGTPPNRDAIVKFQYQGNSGFMTHFCLVSRIENGMVYVVDSWDGLEKPAATYGPIRGWATYADNTPQPVAPVQPVNQPAAPADDPNILVVQAGWGLSHCLKARNYPDYGSPARWQWLADQNHIALRDFFLKPGQHIICPPYVAPPSTPTSSAAPQLDQTPHAVPQVLADETTKDAPEKIEVKIMPPDPNAWKKIDQTKRGDYRAKFSQQVIDLAGLGPKLPMNAGALLHVYGTFKKDDTEYAITVNSVSAGTYYNVRFDDLLYAGPLTSAAKTATPPPADDSDITDIADGIRHIVAKYSDREQQLAHTAENLSKAVQSVNSKNIFNRLRRKK